LILHKTSDEQLATDFFKYHYHDRGMLKWGGCYLSDHTSALKKMRAAEVAEVALPTQAMAQVSELLFSAWQRQQRVHLQLEQLEGGEQVVSLTGLVIGLADNELGIQTDEQQLVWLVLAMIKHVELLV